MRSFGTQHKTPFGFKLFGGFVGGFILLVFIGIIASIGVRGCQATTGMDRKTAEDEARRFGRDLGLNVVGVACTLTDTDGDGYVSCTLSVKDGDGKTYMEPIECSATFTLNEGCRMQKPASYTRPGAR